MKNSVKELYRIALSWAVILFGKKKALKDSVLIFSLPRSGSTWLMSVIQSFDDYVAIFEPLRQSTDTKLRKIDRIQLQGGDPNVLYTKDFRRYITPVLLGIRLTRWSSNHTSRKIKLFSAKATCVKFIRSNALLYWFNANYPELKKILLIRHPGAVVESLIRSPGDWTLLLDKNLLLKKDEQRCNSQYNGVIRGSNSAFEDIVIFVCLEIRILLNDYDKQSNNILLAYESLLQKESAAIRNLVNFLGKKTSESFYQILKRKSNTTNEYSATNYENPSNFWRGQLSNEQIASVNKYVKIFNLEIYFES